MIYLDSVLFYLRDIIAIIGVIVICYGALRSAYHLFSCIRFGKPSMNAVRHDLGDSIILGLEFMVGADIVGSMVEPDYYNLGLLAILVLVRTILSYFLNRELQELSPHQRERV